VLPAGIVSAAALSTAGTGMLDDKQARTASMRLQPKVTKRIDSDPARRRRERRHQADVTGWPEDARTFSCQPRECPTSWFTAKSPEDSRIQSDSTARSSQPGAGTGRALTAGQLERGYEERASHGTGPRSTTSVAEPPEVSQSRWVLKSG